LFNGTIWIQFINGRKETLMKISARNVLKGKVMAIKVGVVNAEVVIGLPGGNEIVSMISLESCRKLCLKKGKTAYAVIKASSVMVAAD
jgi:molybdopterin-binding protein